MKATVHAHGQVLPVCQFNRTTAVEETEARAASETPLVATVTGDCPPAEDVRCRAPQRGESRRNLRVQARLRTRPWFVPVHPEQAGGSGEDRTVAEPPEEGRAEN
jgi:hypothetical protein